MRITFVFSYKNTVTHSLLLPDSAPKSSVRRVRVLCFGSFPVSMGGGNGQKSKMAREKNTEKQRAAAKGSQLDSNKKAMNIQVEFLCFFSKVLKLEGYIIIWWHVIRSFENFVRLHVRVTLTHKVLFRHKLAELL